MHYKGRSTSTHSALHMRYDRKYDLVNSLTKATLDAFNDPSLANKRALKHQLDDFKTDYVKTSKKLAAFAGTMFNAVLLGVATSLVAVGLLLVASPIILYPAITLSSAILVATVGTLMSMTFGSFLSVSVDAIKVDFRELSNKPIKPTFRTQF
jgi:hypothetical protein